MNGYWGAELTFWELGRAVFSKNADFSRAPISCSVHPPTVSGLIVRRSGMQQSFQVHGDSVSAEGWASDGRRSLLILLDSVVPVSKASGTIQPAGDQ